MVLYLYLILFSLYFTDGRCAIEENHELLVPFSLLLFLLLYIKDSLALGRYNSVLVDSKN